MAATSSALTFVRGFRDPDKIGLFPIFQDGFEFGRYGVLACRHIMHLDCRALYEAYEHGCQAPHRLPECSICNTRFWGVCMHLCVIRKCLFGLKFYGVELCRKL